MTVQSTDLGAALTAGKIKTIAIVDDAYDPFDPESVTSDARRGLRRAFLDLADDSGDEPTPGAGARSRPKAKQATPAEPQTKAAPMVRTDKAPVKTAAAKTAPETKGDKSATAAPATAGRSVDQAPVPSLSQRIETALGLPLSKIADALSENGRIEALWALYVSLEPADPLAEFLSPVFGEQGVTRAAKLRPLRKLKALIEETPGIAVGEYGSATDPAAVAGCDMLFLDFYLGDDAPSSVGLKGQKSAQANARERSVKFLKGVVENTTDNIPLVMLISSEASAGDLPHFRKEARMLGSKIAFLPKTHILSDTLRAKYSIVGLTRYREQSDALWKVMLTWQDVVKQASEDVLVSLRELDLHDFSYLHEHRLASEKTPLSEYLIWLLSGKLTDVVEQKMRSAGADAMVTSMMNPTSIPGRIGPTSAITDLYSAVTTSKVPAALGGFKPPTWSGDIYLDTKSHNEIFGKKAKVPRRPKIMPQVLAVLTPACDLVPGRKSEAKLQTVTMIGGSLVPLDETMDPSNYLIMLNDKPYIVNWNFKWPVTMALDAMGPGRAMAGRYQWVGRLREIYHADLQRKLMDMVGRVGLPAPPTMSEPTGVRILGRIGGGDSDWMPLYDEDADARAAWSFPASGGTRAYCLRDDVIWDLRQAVARLAPETKHTRKLAERLDDPKLILQLQHPFEVKDEKKGNIVKYRRVKSLDDIKADSFGGQLLILFSGQAKKQSLSELSPAERQGEKALAAAASVMAAAAAAS
jgi:hypothetical protein